MKYGICLLTLIVFIFIAQLPAQADEQKIILKEGTPVILRLTEEVSSLTKTSGAMVSLAVAVNVEVDGYVVIPIDSSGTGSVILAESSGRVGKAGKIHISIDSAKAVDSRRVPLRSTLAKAGEDNETSSVAMGIICCPLFLLMKGDEAVYPIGTEFKAYVAQDITFSISSLQQP